MNKKKIKGWNILNACSKEKLCVLSERIKIYDYNLKCLKNFNTIKYPSSMKEERGYLYVVTTTNQLYVINLETLEITEKHQLVSNLNQADDFEISSFVFHPKSKEVYFTATWLGNKGVFKWKCPSSNLIQLCNVSSLDYGINVERLLNCDDELILLEDPLALESQGNIVNYSFPFLLKEIVLLDEDRVVQYQLKDSLGKYVFLDYVTEDKRYYIVRKTETQLMILNNRLEIIIESELPDADGLGDFTYKYQAEKGLLTVCDDYCFCEPKGYIFSLHSETAKLIKAVDHAYDCVYMDEGILFVSDTGSNIVLYEELK